jgi:hypothetical protein
LRGERKQGEQRNQQKGFHRGVNEATKGALPSGDLSGEAAVGGEQG